MLVKFSGLNPKGPYLSFKKENFWVVLTYAIKWASETRKFHVPVEQQRLRNVPAKLFFCQSKPNAFFAVAKTPYCCDPDIWLPLILASPLYYSLQILMEDSSFFFLKNNKEMIVPWNFIKHMYSMSQSQGSNVGSENE